MFTDSEIIGVVTPMLNLDEGCRLVAYPDSRGFWTLGWGHHDPTVKPGMTCTQAQADAWRDQAIEDRINGLDAALPWWRNVDVVRAAVMVDMAYEMGLHGFLGFKNTIAFIQEGRYGRAALDMLNSAWAHEVPGRASRLSQQMQTGVVA